MSIVIATTQSTHNEWMAFACWYSVHRNLPESKVAVIFPRAYKSHQFTWLNKCHIPYLAYTAEGTIDDAVKTLVDNEIIATPVTILKDSMMIIRDNLELPTDGITHFLAPYASTTEPCAIVDFRKCSKFNLEEWNESEQKHPFYRTKQLISRNRTGNEIKVFELWKQMGVTFDFLNRA